MTSQSVVELSDSSEAVELPRDRWVSSRAVEATLIDPLDDPEWDRLVLSHPDHTIFHTAAWANVLTRTYGHRPVYLHFLQEGEPLALIPMMEVESRFTGRRGVCLPFTDFCGPLIFRAKSDSRFLIDTLSDLARKRNWEYFELRGDPALNESAEERAGSQLRRPHAPAEEAAGKTADGNGRAARCLNPPIAHAPSGDSQSLGSQLSPTPAVAFHGHTLDLHGDAEELRARFTSSVRRAIGKGERSDLTVQVTRTKEAMLEFYRLHVLTRRRHGVPPQPVSFFVNIYEEIIKHGLGFVVLAQSGLRTAAAAVFFHLGKKAVYKFGASDERLQELRANNLVIWEAIRWLSHKGIQSLHFGRTSLENHGLRRFKSGWGTTEERIKYFKRDTAANEWVAARDHASGFHNAIFRRLPLALNRLAGSLIYPHLD